MLNDDDKLVASALLLASVSLTRVNCPGLVAGLVSCTTGNANAMQSP